MANNKKTARGLPATMLDIAERVGVSKVTVSAVLTGSAGNNTRVAPATRERILEAARELNYAPNGIAKMFRRSRTDIVGLYLGERLLNTHDLFLAEVVSGLQTGCLEHQKDLLIHGAFRGQSIEDIYLELTSRKIDGLIIFAQENDALTARLASSSLPVVAITDAVSALPSVVADDRGGSRLLARYLASKGHVHVLYRRGWHYQASASRRYEAFQEAATQLGMTITEDVDRIENFDIILSDGEKTILSKPISERPSAIVCSNDRLAYEAFDYCQECGLRIPNDIAIVGFDGIVPQFRPAAMLTTIRAPWSDVARTAFELVMRRIEGETVPDETVLPVELVIGKTA
jgi:DNA-binding LacI/PurR family transcriptional regulator